MPEVTVLTAVRNGAKFLPETIESIQNQTFEDWEYIIVDDASIDNTLSIIESYAKEDNRIIPLHLDKRGGPFAAANQGLRLAKGRYIVRTDGDDISLPNRIQRQVDFLESNPPIRACVSYGQLINENSEKTGYSFKYPASPKVLKWFLCLRCPLIHSSTCIEKEAMHAIGGYRELPASQDYRFFADLSQREWLSVIPEDLVYLREHRDRITNKKTKRQFFWGCEIKRDQIFELTGEEWGLEDAKALFKVAWCENFPIDKGLRVLERWQRLWKSDTGLLKSEREELAKIALLTKRRFLRKNLNKQPIRFLLHISNWL